MYEIPKIHWRPMEVYSFSTFSSYNNSNTLSIVFHLYQTDFLANLKKKCACFHISAFSTLEIFYSSNPLAEGKMRATLSNSFSTGTYKIIFLNCLPIYISLSQLDFD